MSTYAENITRSIKNIKNIRNGKLHDNTYLEISLRMW